MMIKRSFSTNKQSGFILMSKDLKRSSSGFTLIEILASISIMAVVFGIIISSTTGIKKAARDGQRQADLRNIQSALQQYYADQNFFPTALILTSSTTITSSTGNTSSSLPSPVKTYMSTTPLDPLAAQSYGYYSMKSSSDTTACTDSNCHYYSLCAVLEGNSPQAVGDYAKCTGKNTTGVTYTFQVNPS